MAQTINAPKTSDQKNFLQTALAMSLMTFWWSEELKGTCGG
jgi:hypothetical protein